MLVTDIQFARTYRAFQPATADALKSMLRRLPPEKPRPEPVLVFDGTGRPRERAPDFVCPINDD